MSFLATFRGIAKRFSAPSWMSFFSVSYFYTGSQKFADNDKQSCLADLQTLWFIQSRLDGIIRNCVEECKENLGLPALSSLLS
jgi:hypothetical protein